jgi:hypothetical protein
MAAPESNKMIRWNGHNCYRKPLQAVAGDFKPFTE